MYFLCHFYTLKPTDFAQTYYFTSGVTSFNSWFALVPCAMVVCALCIFSAYGLCTLVFFPSQWNLFHLCHNNNNNNFNFVATNLPPSSFRKLAKLIVNIT